MTLSRQKALVEKSLSASLAAIEIYNKPSFSYREETFAILMLNAWELLLKARVLKENNGAAKSLEVFETIKKMDGSPSKRKRRKLNRSGNPMTIGLDKAANLVSSYSKDSIDQACLENLSLLKEVRDNASHMINISAGLGFRVHEIGSASLKNYTFSIQNWFDLSLSKYNFYLMPLAFHTPSEVIESLKSDKNVEPVRNFINLVDDLESRTSLSSSSDYQVTLQVRLSFLKSKGEDAISVRIDPESPDATPITISDEDYKKQYPWNYDELSKRLKARYANFLQNQKYHKIRQPLEKQPKLCHSRALDPSKPNKTSKRFYNPNILAEFDKYYTKK